MGGSRPTANPSTWGAGCCRWASARRRWPRPSGAIGSEVSTYILRRLGLFVPTLVGASILIFVLMRLVPGDIAEILVYQTGSESSAVQKKQIQQIRRELGLERPIVTQDVDWIARAARCDFGQSYLQRRPGMDILRAP